MTVAKAAVAPGAEPQELVGVDIKGVIRPSLAQIKAVIIDKVHEARCVLACVLVFFPSVELVRDGWYGSD